MNVCPSCARESPADFAFCPGCGAKLGAEPRPFTEERKVVTTLCCDLVSYTAHSEAADHELIDAMLQRYNALAKRLVEGHGGVVEKFIGDAVLAVFGFPHAHDDDAERAVRCALKLAAEGGDLAWPDGDAVQVRIGVNSGETYLHTGVDPASGDTFITGDAVNTAARLETAAPPGGVVVGALTNELTNLTIVYEELEPLALKGKAEPVPAWLTKGVREDRSRTGLRTTGKLDTPFLGREKELHTLQAEFDAAASSRRAHFVLLVGEPGIGKSRLVLEFARSLETRPQMVTWRQGRCLAFGDRLGFSALSDILKADAGILDSDDVAAVEEKLEQVLPEGEDKPWLRQRLRLLLGLESSRAERAEDFAAWTLLLDHIASSGPTVVVLEDLHWAGEGMLAYVEHLASQEPAVPLLVVATARPELLQRRPGVLATSKNIKRLKLSPLGRRECGRLVSALLDERLAADVRAPVLERVGGNPLYAEEYVRLLLDRGLLLRSRGVLRLKEGEELPLPDTVQAVLAARLDTLPSEHKVLLCDAAIFGERFSDGGVASLAQCSASEVGAAMVALVDRQLIRPVQSSSPVGESEFLFWHALTRDAAYAQLPRRTRVERHVAAADWLEARAGGRLDEVAEVLAHHYVTALELAEALQDNQLRESLVAPSLRCLGLAGARALDLDAAAAELHFARALELAPADGPERPRLLARWAMAVDSGGRSGEAAPALEEAIAGLLAAEERHLAAEALVCLSSSLQTLGRPDDHAACLEAIAVLEGEEPCLELVFATYAAAIGEGNHGRPERARQLAERALASAEQLGLSARDGDAKGSDYYRRALMARGIARCQLGDVDGLDDLREASEAALTQGVGPIAVFHYAYGTHVVKGPSAAVPIFEQGIVLCRDRGRRDSEISGRENLLEAQCDAGAWDEVLAASPEVLNMAEAAGDVWSLIGVKTALALLLARRGETDLSMPLILWSLQRARESRLPILLPDALVAAATVYAGIDEAVARRLLDDLPDSLDSAFAYYCVCQIPQMLRTAHKVAAVELAEKLTAWVTPRLPAQRYGRAYGDALLAEGRGEHESAVAGFQEAVTGWHGFGVPYEEGHALLGQGRCLVALGRAPEAAAPLAAAREVFARLGARPALAAADDLFARTGPDR